MGRRAAPPVVAAEVAELAGIAAGPQLLARLVAIHEPALTGHESVLYLAAWQRMANYAEARVVGAVAGHKSALLADEGAGLPRYRQAERISDGPQRRSTLPVSMSGARPLSDATTRPLRPGTNPGT